MGSLFANVTPKGLAARIVLEGTNILSMYRFVAWSFVVDD